MKLVLSRFYSDDKDTLGILTIEGVKDPVFYTMERPWLDNQPFASCIPRGVYKVRTHHSRKFVSYPDVWQVMDVSNRAAILLHVANWSEQLEGCIAIGTRLGYLSDKKAVLHSVEAFDKLKEILGYPSEFDLTII